MDLDLSVAIENPVVTAIVDTSKVLVVNNCNSIRQQTCDGPKLVKGPREGLKAFRDVITRGERVCSEYRCIAVSVELTQIPLAN
jgi:hypothetical protein